jgi:hypothetical protein
MIGDHCGGPSEDERRDSDEEEEEEEKKKKKKKKKGHDGVEKERLQGSEEVEVAVGVVLGE